MKPICEVMVMEVLPGIRSILARRLIEKHSLSQKAAAERLGTTQPAISQYKQSLRGSRSGGISMLESSPKLMEMIDAIASRAASGKSGPEDITSELCTICKFMRSSGLACDFHRKMYPSLENCRICLE